MLNTKFNMERETAERAAEIAYLPRLFDIFQNGADIIGSRHLSHPSYRPLITVYALPAAPGEGQKKGQFLQFIRHPSTPLVPVAILVFLPLRPSGGPGEAVGAVFKTLH